ncbi:Alanine aminotransferase 2 [Asimina triloba]
MAKCHVVRVTPGADDNQTAALDGETDLKTRGAIECPSPDKDIRRFDANLRLFPPFIDNDLCPLNINNTLLQSCYLRNTEWACGVAVYTDSPVPPNLLLIISSVISS